VTPRAALSGDAGRGSLRGVSALVAWGRAALDRVRIVVGREPPDTQYARLHGRAVRKACRRAARGDSLWLRAVPAWRGVPGLDERVVELPWVYERLARGGRLLDVGSTLNSEWHIEHLCARFTEITFLNPYRDDGYRSSVAGVSYVERDAREPDLPERAFARITCISTLEHIGCDNTLYGGPTRTEPGLEGPRQARAAAMRALRPLVAPGGALLLTVPYGHLEDHGWFVQLDAHELEDAISAFAPAAMEAAYFLFDRGWRAARPADCADARYGERTRGSSAAACVALRV